MSNCNIETEKHAWSRHHAVIIAEDLRFAKRQQWVITNYVLILFAILVGITTSESIWTKCSWAKDVFEWGIVGLACILALAGVYYILDCHRSIVWSRFKVRRIEKLDPAINDGKCPQATTQNKWTYYLDLVITFIVLIGFGLVIVCIAVLPDQWIPCIVIIACYTACSFGICYYQRKEYKKTALRYLRTKKKA